MTEKKVEQDNSSNGVIVLKDDGRAQRLDFFDIIRGIGIILIIFLHATVYHYEKIGEIDLENLNPLFLVLYVILNWAGLFALISSVVNTYSSYFRYKENLSKNIKNPGWIAFGKRWIFLGIFFLIMNFFYNFLVGPFLYDFDLQIAHHSFLPGVIRTGQLYVVSPVKLFQGSTFSMLGWNLIIMGTLFSILFNKSEKLGEERIRQIILSLGIVIVVISFFRIYLFDAFDNAISSNNFFLAFLIDFIAGSYFPIFPYLGFGLIGAYVGLLLSTNPTKEIVKKKIWIGIGFLVGAVIAFLIPDSIYEAIGLLDDILFSYIIVLFEIGVLITIGAILFLAMFDKRSLKSKENQEGKKKRGLLLIFSTNSLTFFLLERPIAEIFALVVTLDTVEASMLFGGFMVIFWILIAMLWSRINFKYSFEWLLTKLFQKVKYQTDKSY